jgi:hypothetical protein
VWDQELLDQLYANAATYLHGHSVGGTNPSLLRAMGAGAATIAYDVAFNREVAADSGRYFTVADDVAAQLEAAEADPAGLAVAREAARRLATGYDWDDVALRYERLLRRLAAEGPRRRRPTGRRAGTWDPTAAPVAPGTADTTLPAVLPFQRDGEPVSLEAAG